MAVKFNPEERKEARAPLHRSLHYYNLEPYEDLSPVVGGYLYPKALLKTCTKISTIGYRRTNYGREGFSKHLRSQRSLKMAKTKMFRSSFLKSKGTIHSLVRGKNEKEC